jgi:hypothetical protein
MLICLVGAQLIDDVNWSGKEINVITEMSCGDASWADLVQIHV